MWNPVNAWLGTNHLISGGGPRVLPPRKHFIFFRHRNKQFFFAVAADKPFFFLKPKNKQFFFVIPFLIYFRDIKAEIKLRSNAIYDSDNKSINYLFSKKLDKDWENLSAGYFVNKIFKNIKKGKSHRVSHTINWLQNTDRERLWPQAKTFGKIEKSHTDWKTLAACRNLAE